MPPPRVPYLHHVRVYRGKPTVDAPQVTRPPVLSPAGVSGGATDCPPRPRMVGPRRSPTIRHLAYHCYPRSGSPWPTRLLNLKDHLSLFNGRRIIAIVTDDTTDSAEDVYDVLGDEQFTHLELRNQRDKREGETLVPLFECLEDLRGPEHCTLWGHAKGVTRGDQPNIQRWAETQEELLLDYWPVVERELTTHACCGAFKKDGLGWGPHESLSDWHYSGAWFWFRNDQLFTSSSWKWIDRFWGAIESYPSRHWPSEDAASVFGLSQVPFMNLYKQDYWETHVAKPLDVFRAAQRKGGVSIVHDRLNVGCGPFRAEGWHNTDYVIDDVVKPDQIVTPGRSFPFPDKSFTAVYAGHVIEHVWWDEVIPWLREIKRVVKPGGTVCIVGPDSKKVIHAAIRSRNKDAAESKIWEIIEDYKHHQVEMADDVRTGLTHLWNAYEARVVEVMIGTGFRDVRPVDWTDNCLPGWPVVDYSNPDQFGVLGVVP
jgi:predicted SAM-dependent methyltransferase